MKHLSLLLALAAAVSAATSASAQFTVGGLGGATSPLNTSSGNNCDTLPDDVVAFPASSAVPANATGITSVELIGLTHTWVGDVQIVLRDPNGLGYNLVAPISTSTLCTSGGDSSNYNGDYTVVAACDNPMFNFLDEAVANTDLTPGTYATYFGAWISGSAGVINKDISAIESIPGIWTLEIYDGAGGDVGALVEWRMNGTTGGATSYSGGGGPIPLMDTGTSGDRCSMLPNDFNTFPLAAPVAGGSSIDSVTLTGLNHTWVGDLQIVLVDPNGTGYNLCSRINTDTMACTGFGSSSDFMGDYTFVPAGTGGGDILAASAVTPIAPGAYDQFYGVWIDGSASIFNTDLASIPVIPGTWTLAVYDGAGGDTGDLAGWSMSVSSGAEIVCDGEINSTGAAASFSVSGSTSIATNDLTMHVENLPTGSFGFFLVGDTCVNVPMPGGGQGTLCVGGDLRRGVGNSIVTSGAGNSVSLAVDLANIPTTGFGNPSGVSATPYQRLFLQYWYRDFSGGMATSNLSNALLVVPTN